MSDESPQIPDQSIETPDESTRGEPTTPPPTDAPSASTTADAAAPAAAPAAPAAAAPATAAPATAFENITNALKIMTDPLGISGLAKELADSIAKIVTTAQTAPMTLAVVAGAEVQRLSMLIVKHQVDNFKVFPDISKQIAAILAALSKSDSTGLLTSSQALLSIAPSTTAAATGDISSTLITNVLSNPLLTTNLKQLNDITDQINAALVDSEIIRFNENMLKLSSTLFPLLVAKKQP